MYAYVAANPVNLVDLLGFAYFAYRPLAGIAGVFGVIGCTIDDRNNTVIGHEQLFFEDGKNPPNAGYFSNSTIQVEQNIKNYRSSHDAGWNYCVMRKAIATVKTKPYKLLGGSNNGQYNCQDWAEAVRREYRKLVKQTNIIKECCLTDQEKNK